MKRILAASTAIVLALSACSATPPISNQGIVVDLVAQQAAAAKTALVTDLVDADFNLKSAMAIGVLNANDPGSPCIEGALAQAGVNPDGSTTTNPSAQSFVPKNGGPISLGSIAYIRSVQIRAALKSGGSLTIPVSCEAIVGKIVMQGLADANGVALGAITRGLVTVPAINLQ